MVQRSPEHLDLLEEYRIAAAQDSLCELLGDLCGLSFIDLGCGGGLFSLAARNLGARVVSVACDSSSVLRVKKLRRDYHAEDECWRVTQGSVLDEAFMRSLEPSELVYSWGVLEHTGEMW